MSTHAAPRTHPTTAQAVRQILALLDLAAQAVMAGALAGLYAMAGVAIALAINTSHGKAAAIAFVLEFGLVSLVGLYAIYRIVNDRPRRTK